MVRHETNRGKGRALKTGFHHAAALWPGEDVVCADSDGQHTPADVLAVAAGVTASRTAMVLGARRFTGPVPSRSRLGNGLTRRVFFLTTGIDLTDTQTGLRAYPAEMLGWLLRGGGRALRVRAGAAAARARRRARDRRGADQHGVPRRQRLVALPPGARLGRVYAPLLRFAASSALAAVIDYALLFVLHGLTGSLVVSVVGARASSAGVNYATNRRFVFRRGAPTSAPRYAALVAAILAANWALMHTFVVGLGTGLLLAKLVTEGLLLFVS